MNRLRNPRAATLLCCHLALVMGRVPRASHAAPPDRRTTLSSRLIGPQFRQNRVLVTGADGATATVLPNGSALWVFGDTVVGRFDSIRGLELTAFPSNSAVLVPPQDAAQGIREFRFLRAKNGKHPRQIVPYVKGEDPSVHRVWAMHGVCIADHMYLFYHRISLLKDADVFVNFRLDGMGLARADLDRLQAADWQFERLRASDGSLEYWKPAQPTFGVWTQRDDRYCYLWGSLMTGMFLARVEPHRIEDLAAYEYLVAAPTRKHPDVVPRWSHHFTATASLFDGVPNEISVTFNRHLEKYVAVHALGRGGDIVMRTAKRITGPWSVAEVIHHSPPSSKREFVYAAKEHPELARDKGRIIYVTFVDSGSYIPQLLECTLR